MISRGAAWPGQGWPPRVYSRRPGDWGPLPDVKIFKQWKETQSWNPIPLYTGELDPLKHSLKLCYLELSLGCAEVWRQDPMLKKELCPVLWRWPGGGGGGVWLRKWLGVSDDQGMLHPGIWSSRGLCTEVTRYSILGSGSPPKLRLLRVICEKRLEQLENLSKARKMKKAMDKLKSYDTWRNEDFSIC